jgi:hypothetical protein
MRRPALTAALFVAVPPLVAQAPPEVCRATARFTVGQYAEYRMTGGRGEGTTTRMAIVDQERRGDTTWLRYELATTPSGDTSKRTVMQMTVAGLGTLEFAVRDIVMKTGDREPVTMPAAVTSMMSGQVGRSVAAEVARRCSDPAIAVVGWETVTVPAGTYRALHMTTPEGDVWALAEGFGMVKMVAKDGKTMELTARGTDARPSFD